MVKLEEASRSENGSSIDGCRCTLGYGAYSKKHFHVSEYNVARSSRGGKFISPVLPALTLEETRRWERAKICKCNVDTDKQRQGYFAIQ